MKQVKKKIPNAIRIPLTAANISKFAIEILYYKQQGQNVFILEYDYEQLRLPFLKICEKLREPLIKLIQNYEVVVYISGLPTYIFEKHILTPELRWKYEDKLLHIAPENDRFENGFYVGVDADYTKRFGRRDLVAPPTNEELVDLHMEELTKLKNEHMRSFAEIVISDYEKDKYYGRKRIVFVKSVGEGNAELYKERFVYYIYNRKDDFVKTMELLSLCIEDRFLEEVEVYLLKAKEIVLSFAAMQDNDIRKSLYFSINELDEKELESISKKFKIQIDNTKKVEAIGVDFKNTETQVKIYYKIDEITKEDIKELFSEFPIENKKKFLNFLNSCTKPLKNVLLDFKYKEGVVIAKRLDISMSYNICKTYQVASIVKNPLEFLKDKELHTLSFEIRQDAPEKVNFYYGLEIPEVLLEEELAKKEYIRY